MQSPSIQSRSLSLRLCHFWFLKKGFEGQTIHLKRRHQTVRAELVHNAAPGILRDSYSPPCVTVGQVLQQLGPTLLTYRYWFLFLGLWLIFFLMPLIHFQNSAKFNIAHSFGGLCITKFSMVDTKIISQY